LALRPESQEAIVTIFRAIESLGKKPSNPTVFETVRRLGFRFKDSDAKALLAKFRPGPALETPRERPAPAPVFTHERPDSAPPPPRKRPGRAGAPRAGVVLTPIPSPSPIDFGDFERDVAAFVALLAEKNVSGKVTPSRVASVRSELAEWRERYGNDAMLAGIRAAIDHSPRKPVPYARAVAEHYHDPGRATNGARRQEPEEPDLPDYLDLFPDGVTR
jgi:hypothetical protein